MKDMRAEPLTRRVDIMEARVLRILALTAVLIGTLAVVCGSIWMGSQSSATSAPPPAVSRVTAETDAATRAATPSSTAIGSYGSTTVSAHWTWNGAQRTGTITVPANTPAGTRVPLTVDSTGAPASLRPAPASAGVMATVTGFVLLALTVAAYVAARLAVRRRFDEQRDKQWDHDLAVFYGRIG
ncbi:hypothetical protein GCM10007304_26360 [Rhodococcoides trifolii]|uniref:Transmembrane protein n=1 Tax=Rhodococcoides trifolii TaxID=908250 RepID=A0A917FX02_9NOCA|nr:hypothetical protein [Rhodococcus trifolii]GGG11006.1 hypothetical protein GCM10007304_26360 [Rhodococcus trifolii]